MLIKSIFVISLVSVVAFSGNYEYSALPRRSLSRLREYNNLLNHSTQIELILESPEWLNKLKQKLPRPPYCGYDSSDRIIAGNITQIDEFSWTVLINYIKCELYDRLCLVYF